VALEAMYQELSASRDERLLAEVEQAVVIAMQQLQFAGNVEAALSALQGAEARLARTVQPQFLPVRKLLAREGANGEVVGDVEQVSAFLEANDKDLLKDTIQAPLPKGKAGSFPSVGTWAWSVFSASKQIDASKAMIQDIMQPDKLQAVYEKVGGFSKKEAAEIVESVFNQIKETLERGEKIKISGFGNFIVREKKARIGRNPQTGEEITISARRVLTFKPSQVLKNVLNPQQSA